LETGVSDPTPDQASQPIAIARIALRNLTAHGLAPTPENYAHEYASVAGQPLPAGQVPGADGPNAETMRQLEDIIAQVCETSAGLASGVDRFQVDTGPLLANVGLTPTKEAFDCLLQAFTSSTSSLQQTVETSRQELREIRWQLDQANGELRRVQELARTDPLTGLSNRRALNEIIVRDIARAHRTRDTYSVAILDIDYFKKDNDRYGHAAGDQALLHIAFVAKGGVRETDAICRYGGEEFIVLLPGAGADGAHFVVDRLRMMMEKTPLVYNGDKITLRFSAGVAQLQAGEDAERLLERADQALYQAKREGRNRVCVAGPAPAVMPAMAR
jgi:diguanylate cyclase